jgi:hypothetical protein
MSTFWIEVVGVDKPKLVNLKGPPSPAAADDAQDIEQQADAAINQPQPQTPVLATIDVYPKDLTLYGEGWQNLKATGYFSDGSWQDLTNSVQWFTADPDYARFYGPGRVFFTGKTGSVCITAVYEGGVPVGISLVSVLAPKWQPPGQPDNTDPFYPHGDARAPDAVSGVEGHVEGTAGSGPTESTNTVTALASSGGDVSCASSTDASGSISGSASGASD